MHRQQAVRTRRRIGKKDRCAGDCGVESRAVLAAREDGFRPRGEADVFGFGLDADKVDVGDREACDVAFRCE